ncbi:MULTISPECIES: hypothetical protein [Myxococcus]|uniref:Uncharacterized protein n=1 Tax=Myxococcus llanfairpwllgwyngyllgogerychwyrndrobwllllantysiliogogogochensis TaxID=2590453 RepID=A0A540WSG9_9BACT|nr:MULTISPECIES: hypothetical protein [Myxococcus]NTX03008.1 hypothetical protein [Myxococcus sp. CA040A]NTX11429.1 hypothetical protein [Myxococcus sp. CA056]NTX34473.1 hypothetical protein [Myxococcus sp. CA033]NTX56678.1 hypothetical protein [Myxococcus sp. CA039A]TQF11976.1 hypothetical protein FJV41_31430 [Myxococcus llanfairpwllgwyngyllgogerychwyrndrobwllllantysiliogogogochensis]
MKFQCEACERLIPLESFRMEGGGLVVSCQRCGAESRARASLPLSVSPALSGEGSGSTQSSVEDATASVPPLPARASTPALRVVRGSAVPVTLDDEALFTPPPGHCPKCVSPRREVDTSCAQCGLVYANFMAEEHKPSDDLMGAWRSLAEHWEEWEAHDRLLTLAMGRGELASAGRLYRVRLARAPDDAVAHRAREEVVRRATLVVPTEVESSEVSPGKRRLRAAAIAALSLVVLVLFTFIIQRVRLLFFSDLP